MRRPRPRARATMPWVDWGEYLACPFGELRGPGRPEDRRCKHCRGNGLFLGRREASGNISGAKCGWGVANGASQPFAQWRVSFDAGWERSILRQMVADIPVWAPPRPRFFSPFRPPWSPWCKEGRCCGGVSGFSRCLGVSVVNFGANQSQLPIRPPVRTHACARVAPADLLAGP
jgi:hypothetical protein